MNRLTTALTAALYWRMAWQDSNPDIGMAPGIEMVFGRLLEDSGIEIKDSTKKRVIAAVKQWREREHR